MLRSDLETPFRFRVFLGPEVKPQGSGPYLLTDHSSLLQLPHQSETPSIWQYHRKGWPVPRQRNPMSESQINRSFGWLVGWMVGWLVARLAFQPALNKFLLFVDTTYLQLQHLEEYTSGRSTANLIRKWNGV